MSKEDSDRLVEQWKIKKLIKELTEAKGNGTSMISLIIPPKDQVSRISKLLSDEYGTASNIKSRVNRLSVLSAITSAIQRLKNYNKVPPNGLVVYCGTILNEDNKERKFNLDFEPFKPINTSLYLCDNKFHTEALKELLEEESTFGFVVMDGSGCLFGTLCGSSQSVLHKFTVDLPKKHGRGGQSAVRFARLRTEKRHNYVRKVAETASSLFIANDKPTVEGLVLAGSASFKNELAASDIMDHRLKPLVIQLVDVSYGGENGFNQAVELSAEALSDVKFIGEKKLIAAFMSEVAADSGKFCSGVIDSINALEAGAVEKLIVWENLCAWRCEMRVEGEDGESTTKVIYLDNQQLKNRISGDKKFELENKTPLLDWIADNYKSFGTKLNFITDCSQEGAQFVKGFGGIGGVLRYQINFDDLAYEGSEDSDF